MADRVVTFQSMVFRRSDYDIVVGDLAYPTGGSYASPVPDNAYWSRIPLPGNEPLYVSMRIFTSDGLPPQEDQWSPPTLFVKHGDKGDTGSRGDDGASGIHGLNGVGAPGSPGINGADGVAGTSIVWVGEAASHPVNPNYGTAYYNTTVGKSFIYYDMTWYQMTVDGTNGQNGYHSAIVNLYRKSTSASVEPESFSGTFTYNFTTALLSGGVLNGWSQTMPASAPGEYIWVKQASAVSDTTTDTIAATEFSGGVVISGVGLDGVTGLDGTSVVLKGSVATVNDLPTGVAQGDLYVVIADGNGYVSDGADSWTSVGAIQGPPGAQGYSVQIVYHDAPATGDAPALPTNATGTNNGWYDIITSLSNWMTMKVDDGTGTVWGTAKKVVGIDGLNSATVMLYRKTPTNVSPSIPAGTFTYTFSTKTLSALPTGVFNSWSQIRPSLSVGEFLWMIQATASSRTDTDTIPYTEFSVPELTSSIGADGLSIVWKGDLAAPPANPLINWVYRDTDNGIVYIYNGMAWEVMVVDGNDGPAGTNGTNGINGTRTAILEMYCWSVAAPTSFPAGTSTYTWATGQFTTPATPNGWSITPPVAVPGQTLWVCRTIFADALTSSTSEITWNTSAARPLSAAGVNGTRTAVLDMYLRSAAVPTLFPSGTSVYTWATGQFTAPAVLNGWSLTPPPAAVGETLYLARTVFADSGTTVTSTITWNATTAKPLGTSGVHGTRTAVLEVYKWSAAAPTVFPSGTSTYTWATGAFTAPGVPNGWSLTPGAAVPGQTLYGCSVSFADSLTTATTSITWNTTTAYAVGAAGSNGTRTAILELYKWSAALPTVFPSGTSTYTWATGAFTAPATANGWALTPGAPVPGQTLYACSVVFTDTLTTPSSSVAWNTTTAYAVGAAGTNGTNGLNGADGVNGKDGTSIVWKGNLSYAPANPINGWAYYNITDKKSYVYQSGAWYQMTVDGVDGANGVNGTNGLSIVWKGDLTGPPLNPITNWAYRDTDNGVVYLYNGTAWVMMVADGNDGINGTDGSDGLSVFITYHDNPITSTPATPTGNGTTGGWHTAATAAVKWMSQKVAATSTAGVWGTPIPIKGSDGANGTNGDSIDIIFVRSASTPATPSASVGVPSAPIQWYTSVAAADTAGGTTVKLWSSVGTKLQGAGNYTWDTPIRVDGDKVAEVTVYTRGVPSTTPVGGTYTFGAATPLTTLPTSTGAVWERTIPAGTDPVYTSRAVVSTVAGNTAAVNITGWSNPVISLQNGSNGLSVYITYHDAPANGTAPSRPTSVDGTDNGWHTYATAAANWMSQKVDDGTTTAWSNAIRIGGTPGATGATGLTGTSTLVVYQDAVNPATPADSVGIPPGWTMAIPATATYAIWETTGVRGTGQTHFVWTTPVISTAGWRKPGQTTIDGNKIYTGDAYVDTLQIKGQAVTIPVSWWNAATVRLNSDATEISLTAVTSIVFDTVGQLLVSFSTGMKAVNTQVNGASYELFFHLYINGVKEQTFYGGARQAGGVDTVGGLQSFSYSKAVAAGTHTVEVKAHRTSGYAIDCSTRSLVLQGAKR